MSTLTQVEQTSPSTPSASQQKLYPKVGGYYMMDSTGTEKQIIDSRALANVESLIGMTVMAGAM